MRFTFLLLPFLLISCASTSQTSVLKPSLSKLRQSNTGVILTIDLNTSGKIKRGSSCHIQIDQDKKSFKVPLKEGDFNYSLPLKAGMAKIVEFSCGVFYYYALKDAGTNFFVKEGEITYLGTIDFELDKNGEMTWGPSTKSRIDLEANLEEMGVSKSEAQIKILSL